MNSTHFLNFADLPEILPFLVLAVLDLSPKSQRIHKQGQQRQMWPSLHQLQEVILILCAVHGTTGKTSQKRIHDHSNSWGKIRSINTAYKLKDPACFHN
jgi:hypothetical protein